LAPIFSGSSPAFADDTAQVPPAYEVDFDTFREGYKKYNDVDERYLAPGDYSGPLSREEITYLAHGLENFANLDALYAYLNWMPKYIQRCEVGIHAAMDSADELLQTGAINDTKYLATDGELAALGEQIKSVKSDLIGYIQEHGGGGEIDLSSVQKYVDDAIGNLAKNLQNGEVNGNRTGPELVTTERLNNLIGQLNHGKLSPEHGAAQILALHSDLEKLKDALERGKIDFWKQQKLATVEDIRDLKEALESGKLTNTPGCGNKILATNSDLKSLKNALKQGKLPHCEAQVLAKTDDLTALEDSCLSKTEAQATYATSASVTDSVGNAIDALKADLKDGKIDSKNALVTIDLLNRLIGCSHVHGCDGFQACDCTVGAATEEVCCTAGDCNCHCGQPTLALKSDVAALDAKLKILRAKLEEGKIYKNGSTQYLATVADLNSYATKSDLTNYAVTDGLDGTYVKKEDLSAYATKNDLTNYAATDDLTDTFATKSELNTYATTEALNNSLSDYLSKNDAEENFAKKSDLQSSPTNSGDLENLKEQLKNGTIEDGGDRVLATLEDLSALSEIVTGLTEKLSTLESTTDIHSSNFAKLAEFYENVAKLQNAYDALHGQIVGASPARYQRYAEVFPHGDLTRAKLELLEVGLHSGTQHVANSYASGMFVSAFAGTTRYEPYDDDSDFWLDGKFHGLVLGEAYVSHSMNSSMRYGILVGCGRNRVDCAGETINFGIKTTQHDSCFAAVASHFDHMSAHKKRTTLNVLCGCSRGKNSSARISVQGDEYLARFNDFGGHCFILLSQNVLRFGSVQFGPWAEARYNYVRHKKYEETGSGPSRASLSEVSHDIGVAIVGINLEFGQPSIDPDLKSRLFVRAGFETKQKQRHTTAVGSADNLENPFIAKVNDHCRKGKAVATVGAKTGIGRQCELAMYGTGKFSRKEYTSGSLEVSLTCLF
jgi:hypothetical protein